MPDIYKSRHAGLDVKVRTELVKRHPTTGDVIERTPAIRAEFGVPGPSVAFRNPLTNQMDTLETFRGGVYDLDAVAEDKGWDADTKGMVKRRLDKLCVDNPAMISRVDYIVPPAERPWPTYDALSEPAEIAAMATALGLTGKTLAYERENRQRPELIALLEAETTPDPEPDPEPVLAVEKAKVPEKLERLIVS